MKIFIKIALPIIVILIISFLGYCMVQILQSKKMRDEKVIHIPEFELKTLQGEIFANSDLKQNIPTMLLYFNSDCEFCQTETEEIVSNMKKLEDIQIIFVSNESISEISAFQQKYKLDKYDNIMFLCDSDDKFSKLLELKTIPSSFIYSSEGILLSKNNGPIKANYLLKSINQTEKN